MSRGLLFFRTQCRYRQASNMVNWTVDMFWCWLLNPKPTNLLSQSLSQQTLQIKLWLKNSQTSWRQRCWNQWRKNTSRRASLCLIFQSAKLRCTSTRLRWCCKPVVRLLITWSLRWIDCSYVASSSRRDSRSFWSRVPSPMCLCIPIATSSHQGSCMPQWLHGVVSNPDGLVAHWLRCWIFDQKVVNSTHCQVTINWLLLGLLPIKNFLIEY